MNGKSNKGRVTRTIAAITALLMLLMAAAMMAACDNGGGNSDDDDDDRSASVSDTARDDDGDDGDDPKTGPSADPDETDPPSGADRLVGRWEQSEEFVIDDGIVLQMSAIYQFTRNGTGSLGEFDLGFSEITAEFLDAAYQELGVATEEEFLVLVMAEMMGLGEVDEATYALLFEDGKIDFTWEVAGENELTITYIDPPSGFPSMERSEFEIRRGGEQLVLDGYLILNSVR